MRSSPCSSTSWSSRASRATSEVIAPWCRTSATSRARRIRLAIRGVPRRRDDLVGRVVRDLHPEDPRRAPDDRRQLAGVVVPEPERHPEPVAERRRQEPRAGRGADERERREVERQGPRRGALAEDDVEPEVLESRVEDLLRGAVQAMDLVDEEDVAGSSAVRIAAMSFFSSAGPATVRRPTRAPRARSARASSSRARRACEQDVVERVRARLRRLERDAQLLLDPLLADEVVEPLRPERLLGLVLLRPKGRCEELAHAAALRSASLRSSGDRSGSISASARSASTTV